MGGRFILASIVLALSLVGCSSDSPKDISTHLISNAVIYDGSGGDPFDGDVRFDPESGRIVEIGNLEALVGEMVVDANGLVLAPGFIDPHGHFYDRGGAGWDLKVILSQGITTTVTGMDGFADAEEDLAYVPHAELLQAIASDPPAVNIASFAPHNSIRYHVLGNDFEREATDDELVAMARLVEADMRAGTIGLSTGLEYQPGMHSSTEEIVALSRVAAQFGGIYVSHLRDEDDLILEAIDELIQVGRDANLPVHISHLKLADRIAWGSSLDVLGRLDAAREEGIDVTADVYPYTRWASNLGVLFPKRNFTDREMAEYVLSRSAAAEDTLLVRYAQNPALEGLTIAEIAHALEQDEVTTLMELAAAADAEFRRTGNRASMIIVRGMDEADVDSFMRWPRTSICTDGGVHIAHPRSFGSFPRVLGRFVRERGILSMSDAIFKMSGLTADTLGIPDRGRIAVGNHADLVLFDADTIVDHATMADPMAVSTGVDRVWVNGQLAFVDGETTDVFAGQIVSRPN